MQSRECNPACDSKFTTVVTDQPSTFYTVFYTLVLLRYCCKKLSSPWFQPVTREPRVCVRLSPARCVSIWDMNVQKALSPSASRPWLLVGICWGLACRPVRGQRQRGYSVDSAGRQRRLPLLLRSEPVQPYLISVTGPTEPVQDFLVWRGWIGVVS